MPKHLLATVGLVSAVSLVGVAIAPAANAATDGVRIAKIANVSVKSKKTATIKPKVAVVGKAKVTSSTLTVKKGNKTVVKNKPTAKLGAGNYKVTTTVKYKVPVTTSTTKTTKTSTVGVAAGDVTRASCVLENVEYSYGYWDFDGSCTGSAFDGVVSLDGSFSYYDDENEGYFGLDGTEQVVFMLDDAPRDGAMGVAMIVQHDLMKTTTTKTVTTKTTWVNKIKSTTQSLVIKKK